MTNAEKIRQMTDEKLAQWLTNIEVAVLVIKSGHYKGTNVCGLARLAETGGGGMSVVRPVELLPNYASSKQPKIAIPIGYSDHDDCGYYKCPVCGKILTSWDFYFAKRDIGKSTVTCRCGTELEEG